jgi:hypothetical protein
MYPIPGTVHNKTLNKCILSLVQFTIKPWTNASYLWIVNCTRDRMHLFKVLLWTVLEIECISSWKVVNRVQIHYLYNINTRVVHSFFRHTLRGKTSEVIVNKINMSVISGTGYKNPSEAPGINDRCFPSFCSLFLLFHLCVVVLISRFYLT